MRLKPIPDWDGYFASDDGRVWSTVKPKRRKGQRKAQRGNTPREMRHWPDRDGYRCLKIEVDGRCRQTTVHQLVLEAFVGPCPKGLQARHLDGDPTNNRLENLVWDTQGNNSLDKWMHGTMPYGDRHPNAKLTNEQAQQVKDALRSGRTKASLAREYCVGESTIRRIAQGKAYRRVS